MPVHGAFVVHYNRVCFAPLNELLLVLVVGYNSPDRSGTNAVACVTLAEKGFRPSQ